MKSGNDDLIYKNGMYFTPHDEGPFCPVCYLESNGRKKLMLEKKMNFHDQVYFVCTDEECLTSVFP